MNEEEARQVLLLQAVETTPAGGSGAAWGDDDRRWATRQAVATLGDAAAPERFVVARAVIALQRLLPRDAAAQRWLARRGWHPAWVVLALVLGFAAGVGVDQLGVPGRVNLLAPAVWLVVAWNLGVYTLALLPLPTAGLRAWLASWGLRAPGTGAAAAAGLLWARQAGPLMARRAALVLHAAAAALAAGLVAGLYLRGLVLDYRAGWQSTFLDPAAVQALLGLLLAPASALTGVAVPDVAPLRLGPGADASASAAPWIHLYAASLALAVVLPRTLLAVWTGRGAARLAQRFPLPLDTPYFEALHPLMRPGRPRELRLLWLAPHPPGALFGVALDALAPGEDRVVLRSEEGDELRLLCAPAGVDAAAAAAQQPGPWWAPWRGGPPDPVPALRAQVAGVLWVAPAGAARPAWLDRLGRPVLQLREDDARPGAASAATPGVIDLRARDDGWLAEGRLLQALRTLLDDDPRLHRLADSWTARQGARLDAVADELAATLARLACAHETVADEGALRARDGEADAARERLLQRLDAEWVEHGRRLQALLGMAAAAADAPSPGERAALHARVGEARAALLGGVLSGALAGLKADLLSGGLTMGAGAVAGAVVGGLASAGAARGLNVVRGTDRSFVAWDEAALARFTAVLLQRALAALQGLGAEDAAARLAPALAERQASLATRWRARRKPHGAADEAAALAASLRAPLAEVLARALGGPPRRAGVAPAASA